MIVRNGKVLCVYVVVVVLLTAVAPLHAGYFVFIKGLRDLGGGNWELIDGKYKVYTGGLSEDDGDLDRYLKDVNCGIAAHKPGDGDWMEHLHVHRNPTTGWPTTAYPGYLDAVTKEGCKKLYEVMLLDKGEDPKASEFAKNDGQDDDCMFGDPNWKRNCYSYAFAETGITDLDQIVIKDGGDGADRAVDMGAGLYREIQGPSDEHDTLMYMSESGSSACYHANWVNIPTDNCRTYSLKFKLGPSQIFQYDYDDPGRSAGLDFWGAGDPDYFIED
jgi:hypothetical protein